MPPPIMITIHAAVAQKQIRSAVGRSTLMWSRHHSKARAPNRHQSSAGNTSQARWRQSMSPYGLQSWPVSGTGFLPCLHYIVAWERHRRGAHHPGGHRWLLHRAVESRNANDYSGVFPDSVSTPPTTKP